MAILNDQLKHAVRRLSRAPLFTAITLLTLAIGIGANTVIFSVVEGVILKPLPYPHPEQLIGVWHAAPGIGFKDLNMAASVYFIDRGQSTTLQDIGSYDGDSLSVTGAGEPEHVRGLDVNDGTLPILGVTPVLGRLFTRRDGPPGAPQTVLSFLCLLAAEIRWGIVRHRPIHHHRRKIARDHRRPAARLSLPRFP